MADGGSESTPRRSKVERVVEKWDLEDLPAELARRWTSEGEERHSLRELARYFNERVLQAALAESRVDVLDGEVSNIYRLLTDDDVSAGQRTETRSRLEREGLELAELEADFVSHQAIHTFLTDRQNVSLPTESDEMRLDKSRETLQKLRGRVESVAINEIERLTDSGALTAGDVSVLLSLDIVCNDCGERYDFEELLDEGGCRCGSAEG